MTLPQPTWYSLQYTAAPADSPLPTLYCLQYTAAPADSPVSTLSCPQHTAIPTDSPQCTAAPADSLQPTLYCLQCTAKQQAALCQPCHALSALLQLQAALSALLLQPCHAVVRHVGRGQGAHGGDLTLDHSWSCGQPWPTPTRGSPLQHLGKSEVHVASWLICQPLGGQVPDTPMWARQGPWGGSGRVLVWQ